MTGPVEEYLRELRASLRTPPEETSRILAEAEDHLHESVAAGLAAGLTQTEAAEAAISSFGSVRAVVRAHQTRRGRAAGVLKRLAMAAWLTAGIVLTSVFALSLAMLVIGLVETGPPPDDGPPTPGQLAPLVVFCGLLGPVLLWSFFVNRRDPQRSSG
jgi:uncharacterized membrane protein